MNYLCNPVNINYRYQFNSDPTTGKIRVDREAADPSMILFKGRYYIFASMTLGVWVSDDLANWENHRLPDNLPLYDYAPDVRVIGDYVIFSASNNDHACDYYRTKDILQGPYEKIPGTFSFWDPNLFVDEDGKVYFYWGCSAMTPIYGVEVDPGTLRPLGEKKELIYGDALHRGYERNGENHSIQPATDEEIEEKYQAFLREKNMTEDQVPAEYVPMIKSMYSRRPYIEGAWMTKHNGTYYLQYAATGTQYNVYTDGVYVSKYPLGPFSPAENNPYSYKPGGFLPGAGHGSTMEDTSGNWWHTATMRISVHHEFERRVGLWPAGFDADGELFCNQRYGDWPMKISGQAQDPWEDPEWFLLSYRKKVTASSYTEGHAPELAADENVQTWWQAASAQPGEWLLMDLGEAFDIHAIQVNFADDQIDIPTPGEIRGTTQARYIDDADLYTRWKLEASADGEHFGTIEDKTQAETDLSHDLIVREEGFAARYLRLTIQEVPYGQKPCISGLRVFGKGSGKKPERPSWTAARVNDFDMQVKIQADVFTPVTGYNILWGNTPEKLYHSCMIFGTEHTVGALVRGQDYFVRVDAFNENGITEGEVQKLFVEKDNS